MKNNFLNRITVFGNENITMSGDTPHGYINEKIANIYTYIDFHLIKRWGINSRHKKNGNYFFALDAGAGTGRLTHCLSSVVNHCVAIEPFPAFFKRLKNSFARPNIELHQCTLQDYISRAEIKFDLIILSGVLMYHDDDEAMEALNSIHKILKPHGRVLIRDLGIENRYRGDSPFGTRRADDIHELLRPPSGMKMLIERSGYKCMKWRRSYPLNIFYAMYEKYQGKITKYLFEFSSREIFYPIWNFIARLNLKHVNSKCYFTYLITKI